MIRTRLTNKIFIAATIIASIFTLFFGIYEYRREHAFRVDILHSQLQLNNYRVASRLSSQDVSGGTFSLSLLPHADSDDAIRVTVVDTLGNTVLFEVEFG